MKKLTALLLILSLILAFTSCGGKDVTVDTNGLIAALQASDVFVDQFQEQDERGLSSIVKLDTSLFSEFYYAIGTGYTGEEYGVFTCNSKADAETLKGQLEERCAAQLTTYSSYNEEAIPRIENAVIKTAGNYVVIVCAEHYNDARTIVDKYI